MFSVGFLTNRNAVKRVMEIIDSYNKNKTDDVNILYLIYYMKAFYENNGDNISNYIYQINNHFTSKL